MGTFEVTMSILSIVQLICGCCAACAIVSYVCGLNNPFADLIESSVAPAAAAKIMRLKKAHRACIDRYMSILAHLELALDSVHDEISGRLHDLWVFDNEIRQRDEGKFVISLHGHSDWPAVEAKRQCLEKRLAYIPLCLSASQQSPDEVVVTCTNLAGNSLAELSVHAKDDRLLDLRVAIQKHIPLPESAPQHASWKLVSSEGQIFEEEQNDATISELFRL